jgi:hypothetical protein
MKKLQLKTNAAILFSTLIMACGPTPSPGSGGAGGVGGTAGAGGTVNHPCQRKPSQTVIIGDSYINWVSHTFPTDMARVAGETWRMYAIGGTSMASGGIGFIPDQFDRALAEDPDINTVVMTGGGNDVLVCDGIRFPNCVSCKNGSVAEPCPSIVNLALTRAETLMTKAANAGVRDVVYFFYPHVPNNTPIGGTNPNNILDYALPRVKALCDSAESRTGGKLRCHFVDMIPVFEGHPDYFAAGDIHENSKGSAAMAQAIWSTMQSKCVSQKSGCCQ